MRSLDEVKPAALGRPTSLRGLPRLFASAWALTWAASPRITVAMVGLQLATAASIVVQVLLLESLLTGVLDMSAGGGVGAAVTPVIALGGVVTLHGALAAVGALQRRLLGEQLSREVWRRLLDVTGAVELTEYDDPPFHDQLQRVRLSAAARTLSVTNGLVSVLGGALGVVAGAVALLGVAPVVLPLILVSAVPLLAVSRRAGRLDFQTSVAQSPLYRRMYYLQNLMTGRNEAKEVRAFGLSGHLRERWEDVAAAYVTLIQAHVRRRARLAFLAHGLAGVLMTATMLVVLLLVGAGAVTVAGAGAALLAIRLLAGRVTEVATGVGSVQESALFLLDMDSFLRRGPVASVGASGPPAPAELTEVVVDKVSFTYPAGQVPSLRDVCMTVRRGQVVALVGENGSGKTTLAKVVAGLYRPDSGAVRWDGVDTARWGADSVRERIALVFQDFVRYHLSVRENIAMGRPGRTDDAAVQRAAAQAGAASFIEALPAGYDTILSPEYAGGTDLSLGQWQRLALARALVRDAPIVVLDEPTASLDAAAERSLVETARRTLADRAVLIVSHRFSTVAAADYVYVLRDGRVVEHGRHEGLLGRGGVYAAMARAQEGHLLRPDETQHGICRVPDPRGCVREWSEGR